MSDAWLGVVGTLAGVLVGGFAEAARSTSASRRDKRWALYEDRRNRLEQLYTLVEEHRRAVSGSFDDALRRLTSGTVDVAPGNEVPKARLRMMVQFYAPKLRDDLSRLEELQEKFGQPLAQSILHAKSPEPRRKEIIGELAKQILALDAAHRMLAERVVEQFNELRGEMLRQVRSAESPTSTNAPPDARAAERIVAADKAAQGPSPAA